MFFATCSLYRGGRVLRCLEVLSHRGYVRWTGDAQRSCERSPPNCCV